MSVSSVRRHLDELQKAGALHVKQRYRPEGEGQTSNLYTVVHKPVNDKTVSSTENDPVSTGEQGGYSPVDNITITKEQEPSKTAKEHIAEARRMLKNDTF
jgi:predicted ArsR family transcriptional regulator